VSTRDRASWILRRATQPHFWKELSAKFQEQIRLRHNSPAISNLSQSWLSESESTSYLQWISRTGNWMRSGRTERGKIHQGIGSDKKTGTSAFRRARRASRRRLWTLSPVRIGIKSRYGALRIIELGTMANQVPGTIFICDQRVR
jgi:hypothetical protein